MFHLPVDSKEARKRGVRDPKTLLKVGDDRIRPIAALVSRAHSVQHADRGTCRSNARMRGLMFMRSLPPIRASPDQRQQLRCGTSIGLRPFPVLRDQRRHGRARTLARRRCCLAGAIRQPTRVGLPVGKQAVVHLAALRGAVRAEPVIAAFAGRRVRQRHDRLVVPSA